MSLTTFNADGHIKMFEKLRSEWIELLVARPNYTEAAQMIVTINAKLDLLRILRGPLDE